MYANESSYYDARLPGVLSRIRLPHNVLLPTIHISDLEGASSELALRQHHIDVVFTLLAPDDDPLPHYDRITYHRFDIEDGSGDIVTPAAAIADAMDALPPTTQFLVHCHAGVSRSASVVIYYIMRRFNMTYGRAKKCVKASRRIISPSPVYAAQLKALNGTFRSAGCEDSENE